MYIQFLLVRKIFTRRDCSIRPILPVSARKRLDLTA
jgi:hypothetical protein